MADTDLLKSGMQGRWDYSYEQNKAVDISRAVPRRPESYGKLQGNVQPAHQGSQSDAPNKEDKGSFWSDLSL